MRKKGVRNFYREKKIYCGKDYIEVDVIPCSVKGKGKRKRVTESTPTQKNLNDKNSKRYFVQKANANFGKGDLCVDCTYADKYLPATLEIALKDLENYIRRIKYHMEKKGLDLKYMAVTEYTLEGEEGDDGGEPVRVHHHLIINGGLDRDFIESLWSKRVKGSREPESIGFVNADRLQPNENGIEGRCNYMQKRKKGCKRFTCSQNLTKPVIKPNDSKYSRRDVLKLRETPEDKEHWRKQFPGFEPSRIEWEYNEFTGWAVYVKLRRIA